MFNKNLNQYNLLNSIDKHGSITEAAKELGISYKTAWEYLNNLNNMSKEPLVERKCGGEKGGGTLLTAHGKNVLVFLKESNESFLLFLDMLKGDAENFERMVKFMQNKISTSARNQFLGTITNITKGAVNSEIILDIGGNQICAIITNESVESLELEVGNSAYALIKASWVIITKDDIKTSARNRFKGTVIHCEQGAVNSVVVVELSKGKSVTAVITNESLKNMDIKVGDTAYALVKASHVIIAIS